MKRGVYHQCGDKSQKVVLEHLQRNTGVGVILSPRDLSLKNATKYAAQYRAVGAEVLLDPQFFGNGWSNKQLQTYPFNSNRKSVCSSGKVDSATVKSLAAHLESVNKALSSSAVIGPALIYDSAQKDLVAANKLLFTAAKEAALKQSVGTLATVVLGQHCLANHSVMLDVISHVTSLRCDGYYFACEFGDERVPTTPALLFNMCLAGTLLAATGKPVVNGYATLVGLLSAAFCPAAIAIGASRNLWHFNRDRWSTPKKGGGNAKLPPRFMSTALWGTVIYPDEFSALPSSLLTQINTGSPYSKPVTSAPPFAPWNRTDAKKHLVQVVADVMVSMLASPRPRANIKSASSRLANAIALHAQISKHVQLGDQTSAYQQPWLAVLKSFESTCSKEISMVEAATNP